MKKFCAVFDFFEESDQIDSVITHDDWTTSYEKYCQYVSREFPGDAACMRMIVVCRYRWERDFAVKMICA